MNAIIADIKTKTDDFIVIVKEQSEIFNADIKNHALDAQISFIEYANANADNQDAQTEEFEFKYELFESRDVVLERLEKSRSTWENELSGIENYIKSSTVKEWDVKANAITE